MDHVQQELVSTTLDELNKYKQYFEYLTGLLKDAYQKLLDILTVAALTGTVGDPYLTMPNSRITESNNSYVSLPTVASSPDSSAAIVRNQPYYNHQGFVAGDVIDDLCRDLALPHKGSLLKVVMESEPLLSSLPVSVPLPQWKNPPPPPPLEIPTIPINVSPVGHNLWSTRGYQNADPGLTSAVATGFNGGYAPPVAKRLRFQN